MPSGYNRDWWASELASKIDMPEKLELLSKYSRPTLPHSQKDSRLMVRSLGEENQGMNDKLEERLELEAEEPGTILGASN